MLKQPALIILFELMPPIGPYLGILIYFGPINLERVVLASAIANINFNFSSLQQFLFWQLLLLLKLSIVQMKVIAPHMATELDNRIIKLWVVVGIAPHMATELEDQNNITPSWDMATEFTRVARPRLAYLMIPWSLAASNMLLSSRSFYRFMSQCFDLLNIFNFTIC